MKGRKIEKNDSLLSPREGSRGKKRPVYDLPLLGWLWKENENTFGMDKRGMHKKIAKFGGKMGGNGVEGRGLRSFFCYVFVTSNFNSLVGFMVCAIFAFSICFFSLLLGQWSSFACYFWNLKLKLKS